MNRSITNKIRYILDEYVPPIIRDSKWFMLPLYWIAYRTRHVNEIMDFKSRVYDFSEDDYERFYAGLNSISRNRKSDLSSSTIARMLDFPDATMTTALDVGCGKGHFMEVLHKHWPNLKITGVDIVNGLNSGAFEFVKGKAECLPFPDKSFDIVFCSHTIEHIINLRRAVEELLRVTKKRLVIVTPCQRYYYYTLDEHVNFFPTEAILKQATGLEGCNCEKVDGDWLCYYSYHI